ncbi:MAG: glycosyltransferase family 87 protein, partial [Pirellulaceae bacterium]|nr:glycosyltransferase family 87 protein [Pirellulaceae bacterium]
SLNEGDRSEAVVTPPPSEPASDATTTVGEIGGDDTLIEAEQPSIEFAKNVQAVVESVDTEGETTDTNASSKGLDKQYYGFVWLLTVGGLFVIRLLIDPTMVRRPLLEPNLSTGGLAFMGVSLFVFLMANVVSSQPNEADLAGPKSAEHLLVGTPDDPDSKDPLRLQGPGNAIFHLIPTLVTNPSLFTEGGEPTEMGYVRTAKAMAILSHLAIVIGLVVIGYRHFGNIKTGIGAATLYLMLPYTALETGRVLHVLPAALLIWMVLCYRKPLWAGIFTGLAIGVVYYPLFLLPLWISFYWKRGLLRFGLGVTCTLFVVALSLALVSADFGDYLGNLRRLFGIWEPAMRHMQGVWGLGWDPLYRLPVMAAFVVMSVALALWPPQKNLGTLLSCSAAVMVASQFWHGYGGGLYIAWYLPLTLLTFLRPNLEDRVALTVLGEGWRPRLRRDLLARAAVWILP